MESAIVGQVIIEALVLALLFGVLARTVVADSARFDPGASFAAKQVLEVGVALLGAAVDLRQLVLAGPVLALIIVGGVVLGIGFGYTIGRALGLRSKLAILVAVGNAICGNSAIAAVAPVIRAEKKDVASAIGLTAVLGVCLVLALPLLIPILTLSHYDYGVLVGMSVYAVPQVIAAAFPVSQLAGEVATLVKLTRVLLLGPVVLGFAILYRREGGRTAAGWRTYVPWFVAVFLVLAGLRSAGILSLAVAAPLQEASRWLTTLAMAGLGFGVQLAALRAVGLRAGVAIIGSLAFMVALTVALLRVFSV